MQSNKQIVTCLLGNPVEHSVSDSMFAYFSKISGLKNYKHLKLKIPKTKLKTATISLIVFDFFGANITLPFKESIIKFLDNLDVNSKNIGAVNTIVNKNGKLFGYNTDCMGAMKAIENKLGKIQKTDRVLIFGAGGASRAIIYGLLKKTNLITILIKKSDLNKVKRIQKSFNKNIKYKFITDANIINGLIESRFIINATPVGMYPYAKDSLIREKHIKEIIKMGYSIKNKNFFDAVFNPYITEFLKLAKKYDANICPGIYMMIYQGIEAFNLWTSKKISDKNVEKIAYLLNKKIISSYEN